MAEDEKESIQPPEKIAQPDNGGEEEKKEQKGNTIKFSWKMIKDNLYKAFTKAGNYSEEYKDYEMLEKIYNYGHLGWGKDDFNPEISIVLKKIPEDGYEIVEVELAKFLKELSPHFKDYETTESKALADTMLALSEKAAEKRHRALIDTNGTNTRGFAIIPPKSQSEIRELEWSEPFTDRQFEQIKSARDRALIQRVYEVLRDNPELARGHIPDFDSNRSKILNIGPETSTYLCLANRIVDSNPKAFGLTDNLAGVARGLLQHESIVWVQAVLESLK